MNKLLFTVAVLFLTITSFAQISIVHEPDIQAVPSWHVSVYGGGTYRYGEIQENLSLMEKEYLNHLKWGFNVGADVTYFLSRSFGLVKFHDNHARAKNAYNESDAIDIWFLGPSVSYRIYSPSYKHALYVLYALGYAGFHDKVSSSWLDVVYTGGTFGRMEEIAYEYRLTPNIALGVSLSQYSGVLKKITLHDGNGNSHQGKLDQNQYQSLSHIDLSAGLRLSF